jgi:hypothetical protein
MPVIAWSGSRIRNTDELETLIGSIGAGEGDRDPRLDVEAVECVEHVDVGAVGRPHRTVGLREIDAQSGRLRPVDRGPAIAGERASVGRGQVVSRLHARLCERGQHE